MMRAIGVALALGVVCSGGAAWSQEPKPVKTAEDFAEALKDAPCDEGEVRDNGGACERERATRGFNLGVKARPKRPVASAPVASAPSLLDDLRITFDSGSAQMTPEGEAEAKNFAVALQVPWLSKRRLEIAGHTDASGSRKKNMALSQARADAVVDFLVAQGVDRSRLEAKGYGSEHLAVPSAPRDPANRRVEARSLN